jgi:hypothetical protein
MEQLKKENEELKRQLAEYQKSARVGYYVGAKYDFCSHVT